MATGGAYPGILILPRKSPMFVLFVFVLVLHVTIERPVRREEHLADVTRDAVASLNVMLQSSVV